MEVTAAQMRELERRADGAGLAYRTMMERAGRAVAAALLARGVKSAAVFCGKGNNGGDGFVAARVLRQAGAQVLAVLCEGAPVTPDAAYNAQLARAAGVAFAALAELSTAQAAFVENADAVVDALYGTGFHGALRPAGREACARMNAARGLVLAVDVPSGVAADTGEAGPGCVRAGLTVTFHAPKPCHRLAPHLCGAVETADIGITAALEKERK